MTIRETENFELYTCPIARAPRVSNKLLNECSPCLSHVETLFAESTSDESFDDWAAETIDTHPNPGRVFEWISDNWHDLADHAIEDMAASLKAFGEAVGLLVDWSISAVPDRGEHISFMRSGHGVDPYAFFEGIDATGSCPFTGAWSDEVILDAYRDRKPTDDLADVLTDIEHRVLKTIHAEHDYLYSAEALRELCEANGYEFTEDGAFHC